MDDRNHNRQRSSGRVFSQLRRLALLAVLWLVPFTSRLSSAQMVDFVPVTSPGSETTGCPKVDTALRQFGGGFFDTVWFAGDQLYGVGQVLAYGLTGFNTTLPNPPTHPASAAYDQLVREKGGHFAAAGSYYASNLPHLLTLGFWGVGEALGNEISGWMLGEPYQGHVPRALGSFAGAYLAGGTLCVPVRCAGNARGALGRGKPSGGTGKPSFKPKTLEEQLVISDFSSLEQLDLKPGDPNTAYLVKWEPREAGKYGHAGVVVGDTLFHLRVSKDGKVWTEIESISSLEGKRPGRIVAKCENLADRGDAVWAEAIRAGERTLSGDASPGIPDLYRHFSDVLADLSSGKAVDPLSNCNTYAAQLWRLCEQAGKKQPGAP